MEKLLRSMRPWDDLPQYKAYGNVMARSTCRDCGNILTEETRVMKSVSKKGKQYYLNRCKPCIVEADILLRHLKKQNPQPAAGTPCACCKRIDKLFCDHDHATGKFRAWICRNCNSGIGQLGDSEAGLKQALAYLARTNSRLISPRDNKNHDNDCGQTESVKVESGRRDNIK